jgi:hypothetical protein
MLPEETQKKIYMWGLIGIAVIGAFFLIFAVFLNRGTLVLSGSTPFTVDVGGFLTEMCTEDPCKIQLAPGDYTLALTKEGHLDIERDVNVPFMGEHIEEVAFMFEPYILEVGMEETVGHFTETKFESDESDEFPDDYVSEDKYVVYLARNPENGRQTLYYPSPPHLYGT